MIKIHAVQELKWIELSLSYSAAHHVTFVLHYACVWSVCQIFDAIIVLTSFALDVVFVEGVTHTQGEEAIALLIIFLLWRILRVINGENSVS